MQARDKIDEKSYEYIHESIMKCGIDNLYLPILEDILVRRTYLYELPFEQVKKDVKALKQWLKDIYMEEYSEEQKGFAGFYRLGSKSISLNIQYLKNAIDKGRIDDIYDLLAHEVTHALCKNEYGYDILATRIEGAHITDRNKYSSNVINKSLLELIVTELADRMVLKRGNNTIESVYSSQASGYGKSSEILEMIESAYGIKEKELLNHAVYGRMEMAKFLSEKSGQELGETLDTLDRFEIQYNVLHQVLYHSLRLKEISPSSRYYNFGKNARNLYNNCAGIMNKRIENTQISTIQEAQELCDDLKFDFNRLNFLIEKFSGKIGNTPKKITEELSTQGLSGNFKNDLLKGLYNTKFLLARKIVKMEGTLSNINDDKNQDDVLQEFNLIKSTNPNDIELPNFTADGIKDFSFEINDDTIERHRDEEVEWNNGPIFDYIKNELGAKIKDEVEVTEAINKGKKFRLILDGIRNLFNVKRIREYIHARNFFRKNKRLTEGKTEDITSVKSRHTEFAEGLQIDISQQKSEEKEESRLISRTTLDKDTEGR